MCCYIAYVQGPKLALTRAFHTFDYHERRQVMPFRGYPSSSQAWEIGLHDCVVIDTVVLGIN